MIINYCDDIIHVVMSPLSLCNDCLEKTSHSLCYGSKLNFVN